MYPEFLFTFMCIIEIIVPDFLAQQLNENQVFISVYYFPQSHARESASSQYRRMGKNLKANVPQSSL
jgi:hypothetical protein